MGSRMRVKAAKQASIRREEITTEPSLKGTKYEETNTIGTEARYRLLPLHRDNCGIDY